MFTVPRFHRVCRVDPMAGQHRRLSIAGWFMTEQA
jgi:SM-20-related protein